MGGRGGFGPGFQAAGSKLYRAEYAAVTLAVVAYIAYRATHSGGLALVPTAVWFVLPDIVAFVPIGLSSKRREWPAWGAYLYDAAHTLLVWGLAFAISWVALGGPYWPILGWLAHITADRASGFGLRSTSRV